MRIALAGQLRFPWLKFTTKAKEEYELWVSLYSWKLKWWQHIDDDDMNAGFCKCLVIQVGPVGFTHLLGDCKQFTFDADDHP